jgi:uncharacterized protein
MGTTESETVGPSPRTTLRRMKERGSHERQVIDRILDEGIFCHVGFHAEGTTFVQPMAYARVDDDLYLHGAPGNRMLRWLADGAELCVTVTLLDGLVLARSAFHHSMNYRSVMVIGAGFEVVDDDEKQLAMDALVEHMVPGRSVDARRPSAGERRATLVVRVPIAEASAKVRTGGPVDDLDDLDLPVWAGQIPLALVAGAPLSEAGLPPEVSVPEYARVYPERRGQRLEGA